MIFCISIKSNQIKFNFQQIIIDNYSTVFAIPANIPAKYHCKIVLQNIPANYPCKYPCKISPWMRSLQIIPANFPANIPAKIAPWLRSLQNIPANFLANYPRKISLQNIPANYHCKIVLQNIPAKYPCKISLTEIALTCKIYLQIIPAKYPWLATWYTSVRFLKLVWWREINSESLQFHLPVARFWSFSINQGGKEKFSMQE